jgi:ferredoxin
MPTVRFNGRTIECEEGARLRDVLLEAGETPHNDRARFVNCRGFGTCGTCAVEIVSGEVEPRNRRELWRLDFPPHESSGPDERSSDLRLACQVRVNDDLVVRKYPGFWGQHTDEEPVR